VFIVFVMVASSLAVIAAAGTVGGSSPALAPATASVTSSGVHPSTAYTVQFSESGLPANQLWQVTLGRGSGSYYTDGGTDYLTFTVPNGNYAYSITDISGWHQTTLPYTGSVLVSGAPVTEPTLLYVQVTYPVTFSESGLPSGQNFSVNVSGTPQWLLTDGGTDTLTFAEPNASGIPYSIADVSGWHQTTLPYSGSFNVAGASVTETTLVFHAVTYSVAFSESYLPSGLTWQVTVGGVPKSLTTNGATDTLTWSGEANNTYAYSVADISSWHQVSLPYSGNVVVNGGSVTEPTLAYFQVTYSVVFSESELPSGLTWKVTVGLASESLLTDGGVDAITFSEGNGTFSYSIADVSGWHQTNLTYTGSVAVDDASVAETTLVYSQVTYNVTFAETGLPTGTNWSVTLNGTSQNTTGPSISFTEPNGTYAYSLGIVPGYRPSPAAGSVVVSGANKTVTVPFYQVTYTLTFTESGFPTGTPWSVTIGVTTHPSTGTTVTFTEPNGSYAYTIGLVSGYVPTVRSGSAPIDGTSVNVPVVFTTVTYTVTFTESGLPHAKRWSVALGGAFQSTTGASIGFTVANGTYTYLVQGPGGWQLSVLAPEGTITVNGGSLVQSLLFLKGATSSLTFHEVGLAPATSWCVTIGSAVCTTHATLSFKNLTPGTYLYAIGSFTGMTTFVKVSNVVVGASGSIIVPPGRTFQIRYTYPLTFTESGLPGGTSWTVTSGGLTGTSTTSTIVLYLTNGTYGFTVHKVTGYTASPGTGHVKMAGAPVGVTVRFTTHGLLPVGGTAAVPVTNGRARPI